MKAVQSRIMNLVIRLRTLDRFHFFLILPYLTMFSNQCPKSIRNSIENSYSRTGKKELSIKQNESYGMWIVKMLSLNNMRVETIQVF